MASGEGGVCEAIAVSEVKGGVKRLLCPEVKVNCLCDERRSRSVIDVKHRKISMLFFIHFKLIFKIKKMIIFCKNGSNLSAISLIYYKYRGNKSTNICISL